MKNLNYLIKMEIGKMTISEAYPHLKVIANTYGLKLNIVREFKFARLILANLYNRELN
tara:strand:+ start:2360 stop:2533 length:174 start_codon:yes stop_codon:yes gene_type:complete